MGEMGCRGVRVWGIGEEVKSTIPIFPILPTFPTFPTFPIFPTFPTTLYPTPYAPHPTTFKKQLGDYTEAKPLNDRPILYISQYSTLG